MRKNSTAKRKRHSGSVALIISFILVVSAFTYKDVLSDYAGKAAVVSALIQMPQGGVEYVKNIYKPAEKNNLSASDTFAAQRRKDENTDSVEAAKIFSTPSDITKMCEEYQKKYGSASHSGNIVEKQYNAKSATSVYNNIFLRNTTSSHTVNIKIEFEKKATLSIKDKSKPSVLIFHTHTTESFEMADNGWYTASYSTRSQDNKHNMVRVGDEITKQLTDAGFNVIHDTTIHDLTYNGAYQRSREVVAKILKENPTIQVVLDVHRDAIYQSDGTRIKPVANIGGKKAAQIMIIAGCQDGNVKDFPRWQENLVSALQLHNQLESEYKGIMRPILFSSRKYNMDLTPCSLLVEFGSDSNTLEEAVYTGSLFGKSLSNYLEKYVSK